jgi:hypothetical protein
MTVACMPLYILAPLVPIPAGKTSGSAHAQPLIQSHKLHSAPIHRNTTELGKLNPMRFHANSRLYTGFGPTVTALSHPSQNELK